MITCKSKYSLGILTADCAPILFYDFNKKIIGCAHSGWRGALNGIIENTVEKFKELNVKNTKTSENKEITKEALSGSLI